MPVDTSPDHRPIARTELWKNRDDDVFISHRSEVETTPLAAKSSSKALVLSGVVNDANYWGITGELSPERAVHLS